MKKWLCFIVVIGLISCKDLNLKKESADEILQEELKSINWKEVDLYPTFQTCETVTSKVESKVCFETEMKNAIHNYLSKKEIVTFNTTQDTLVLSLFISVNGEIKLKNIKLSQDIASENQELDTWLNEAIEKLPEIYPAQKRSVPISLNAELPIVLN